ncbi:MAG: hypothetical protein M3Y87_03450 [Myxococcota bacterium]|nr:hypothetical protein [Myxococcota bacterium]
MRVGVAWWCGCAVLVFAGCSLERLTIQGTRADSGPRDAAIDGSQRCTPGSCDDGSTCTDDTCDPALGCVFSPVPGSCDDGVLCNGADSCSGGTCSVHDEVDPCPGGSTCDAATDACTGCESDVDCPGEMIGDFGACEHDPGDVCATDGTRARTVRSYACAPSGTCERSERIETEPCTRTTDGASCGDAAVGPWSACTYPSACGEAGTRSRTVTMPVCTSGSCGTASILETDASGCARSTDGIECGPVMREGWSSCGGFAGTCGERGTQSRVVRTPTCASEACVTMTADETRSCTRDTDGRSCGARSCGAWSACFSGSSCSGSGRRYRTCDAPRCDGGSCGTPASSVESEGCTSGGSGALCVASGPSSCTACHEVGSASCRAGERGIQECTYSRGDCNPGGQCMSATTVPVAIPCDC